jgi:hypothetical protein
MQVMTLHLQQVRFDVKEIVADGEEIRAGFTVIEDAFRIRPFDVTAFTTDSLEVKADCQTTRAEVSPPPSSDLVLPSRVP